jgi:hypothetical protein
MSPETSLSDSDAQIQTQVELAIHALRRVLDLLEVRETSFPPEAKKLVEAGVCLFCRRPITEIERVRALRGVHERCDRKIRRQIKAGATTEAAMVHHGLYAPKSPPGRKIPYSSYPSPIRPTSKRKTRYPFIVRSLAGPLRGKIIPLNPEPAVEQAVEPAVEPAVESKPTLPQAERHNQITVGGKAPAPVETSIEFKANEPYHLDLRTSQYLRDVFLSSTLDLTNVRTLDLTDIQTLRRIADKLGVNLDGHSVSSPETRRKIELDR